MACGLPAVVSDRVGCGADLIIEGHTGRMFPFGDHRELARVVAELAANREELTKMGQAARRHVQNYSIEAAAQGIIAAVRSVCSKKTGTATERRSPVSVS
jgi:glycosyltransferase involved in cell wall biosynthesis